ncbi:unnamed protein product [Cunninghamella blakesleeana]
MYAASLGKCPRLHNEEFRKMINESITTTPELSPLPQHLKSLESVLENRNKKIDQAKFWKDNFCIETDETKALKEEVEQANKVIFEKQKHFEELQDEEIKQFTQLLLEQDRKCDRLNELLNKNRTEIKLNICKVCSQYLPNNISESLMNLHNQNNVHQAYLKIEKKVAAIKNST